MTSTMMSGGADPDWLTQLIGNANNPTLPTETDQAAPASGCAASVECSVGAQVQDALHAYVFGSSFGSQATQPEPPDHPDPVIFLTPRLPSSSTFARAGTHQPRRATVSLASPHYNRLRCQAGDAAWPGVADYSAHEHTSPPTLDAAHTLLAAWASSANLSSQLTIPVEPESTSASNPQPQWDSQSLSHLPLEQNDTYTHSALEGSHGLSSISFLDSFLPTASPFSISNSSQAALGEVTFLNSARFAPAELVSPCTNSLPLPVRKSPKGEEGLAAESYDSNVHLSGLDHLGSINPVPEPNRDQTPGSNSRSRPSTSVPIGIETAAYASDDQHPGLPPLIIPETSSQSTAPDTTCAPIWDPVGTAAQLFSHKLTNPSGFQRGFRFTHGSHLPSNREPIQSSNANADQFMWDEKFIKSLESVIPAVPVGEPRRESDPFPAAPVPQRPWEHRHRYSIANMPCGIPAPNDFGRPGLSSEPTVDMEVELEPIPTGSSRHFASFSTHASQPGSSGAYTAATSVFEDERSEPWPDCQAQVAYGPRLGSLQLEDSSGHYDVMESMVSQPLLSYPNRYQAYDTVSSASLSGPTGAADGVHNIGELNSVNHQLEPFVSGRERGFGIENEPAYGFEAFAARYTPPVSSHANELPLARPSELTLPVFEDAQATIPRPPTRLRRLTMLTRPLWGTERPDMAKTESSYRYPTTAGGRLGRTEYRHEYGDVSAQAEIDELAAHGCGQTENGWPRPPPFPSSISRINQVEKLPRAQKRERSQSIAASSLPVGYGLYDEPPKFGGLGQGASAYPPGLDGSVRPKATEFDNPIDENMVPWQQELRCDEDLYTPIWCRGQNDKKEGFCDMCEGGAWFRLKNSAYWYHKQYFHGVSSTTGHYFFPPRETKRGFSSANRQQILGLCHECNEWVGYAAVDGNGRTGVNNADESSGSKRRCNSKSLRQRTGVENSHEDEVNEVEMEDDIEDEEEKDRAHGEGCFKVGRSKGKAASKVPTLWYKHAHKCHRHQTCKGAKGRKKGKKIGISRANTQRRARARISTGTENATGGVGSSVSPTILGTDNEISQSGCGGSIG
ncbi:hypothetical protein CROQUDRAFT_111710 [Cronartium quercuum f. sp. fusiforme G11]|uniref:Transcription regulator Rua1 C-terminal domain-containing protein n=1 Tax=Cronartium quercuum f. sp. fusiforme G11 TaxID=708437 RepID=A0A9P6T6A3_9BASI|nr:hypothetical protein CROQUDRAFT_111710 [Cronartium quercuum f. sp. fusiforme G11]